MPLTIGVTPFAQWTCLTPLLEHLGWQASQPPTSHLDGSGAGPWLVIHTRPEYAIAHALDQGQTPQAALERWKNDAEQLLNFYKSHRGQAAMVELQGVARNPAGLVDWLTQHHAAFCDLAKPYAGTLESAPRPSELNLLLASQLVAQTPELEGLLTQFEASSIPLDEPHYGAPNIDLNSVINQLNHTFKGAQKEQEAAELKKALEEARSEEAAAKEELKASNNALSQAQSSEADAKEENDLILSQLHLVQEELEGYYLKLQESRQKAEGAQKANDELKKDNKTLKQKLDEQKCAAKAVQGELKTLNESLQQAQQANTRLEVDTQRLTQELANAKSEAQSKETALSEKNELILKQLFHVQEDQERHYRASDGIRAERDKLAQQIKRLNEEISQKNHKLRRFSDEKKQLQARLKLAQDALQHEQADRGFSPLARIAKPLRKLRRAQRLVEQQVLLVKGSELFDSKWYAEQNPDVAAKFTNLAEHYVRHGGQEGRDPSPRFSSKRYLQKNSDVASTGMNPLVHYLLHGKAEGRKS